VDNAKRLEGEATRPGLLNCRDCRKQFSVTVGTVFERSKIPLTKWLACSYLMASSKKGVSSHQIHRTLGITYKTAWFMTHRLREAMRDTDETLLGGPGTSKKALFKQRTKLTDADFEALKFLDEPLVKDAAFAKDKGIVQEVGFPTLPGGTIILNVDY
jgi:hypothetical protein